MDTLMTWKRHARVCSLALSLLSLVATGSVLAAENAAENEEVTPTPLPSLQPLLTEEAQLRSVGVAAQAQVSRIASSRQDLIAEYRKVQKELDIQKLYNEQLQAQIRVQDVKKLEIRQAIEDVGILQRQIPPLAGKMLDSLSNYISLDLPFRNERRKSQIEVAQQSMVSADIKPSEQLRQILEIYDIELQYSRTIGTYDQFIQLGNRELEVSVLRWGRMALLFLSKDESKVGIYNPEADEWQTLPNRFRNAVRKALRMARKQASLDMVLLPVPAAVKVEAAAGDDS